MKYVSYVWIVIRNLLVLGIAIAIFGKAGNDYETIVFSLLVLIYVSISWSMTWHGMITGGSLISLGKEFWRTRKLLTEKKFSNTTLNAVFSEEAIIGWKQASEKSQRESLNLHTRQSKRAAEEIRSHAEAGKDKYSFKPSSTLLRMIEEELRAWAIGKNAQENYDKMIKANLAVLNGASMEEVKKGCELHIDGILGLKKGTYDLEDFKRRQKKYWEEFWDPIVKDEDSTSDEYLENLEAFREAVDEDENEEKRIEEVETKMDEAWIKVYMEGGFASILFFVALWHLLKGLNLI